MLFNYCLIALLTTSQVGPVSPTHTVNNYIQSTCISFLGYCNQWSPNFLAPGISFVENNFSMDQGGVGET